MKVGESQESIGGNIIIGQIGHMNDGILENIIIGILGNIIIGQIGNMNDGILGN